MSNFLTEYLEESPVTASAPCRIDVGGTLDLGVFHYPLRHIRPCTFNIAIGLRTTVRLLPYEKDVVKISSKGFESAEFPVGEAPFDHPLGLMFAVSAYFQASGVHIEIESTSPPRSGLGGSSVAATALVAAFSLAYSGMGVGEIFSPEESAIVAHAIEESVAGVPCGRQDQLAAAFGGANLWYWNTAPCAKPFTRVPVFAEASLEGLEKNILLAYCGEPHESKNINGEWVKLFLKGRYRSHWKEIVACTTEFVDALERKEFTNAARSINREVELRTLMTPEVIDDMGDSLVDYAIINNCGARFTGAGGGGCLFAVGESVNIEKLRSEWETQLNKREEARLLDVKIDSMGLKLSTNEGKR